MAGRAGCRVPGAGCVGVCAWGRCARGGMLAVAARTKSCGARRRRLRASTARGGARRRAAARGGARWGAVVGRGGARGAASHLVLESEVDARVVEHGDVVSALEVAELKGAARIVHRAGQRLLRRVGLLRIWDVPAHSMAAAPHTLAPTASALGVCACKCMCMRRRRAVVCVRTLSCRRSRRRKCTGACGGVSGRGSGRCQRRCRRRSSDPPGQRRGPRCGPGWRRARSPGLCARSAAARSRGAQGWRGLGWRTIAI